MIANSTAMTDSLTLPDRHDAPNIVVNGIEIEIKKKRRPHVVVEIIKITLNNKILVHLSH